MKKTKHVLLIGLVTLFSVGLAQDIAGVNNHVAEAATIEKNKSPEATSISKYGSVTKKNYPLWRNFNWNQKGNTTDIYQQTVFVKYEYKHSNGSSYYSLYDSKSTWLGYVNSKAVKLTNGKQGQFYSIDKKVTVTSKNYVIHQNFNWKKKNESKNFKNQVLTAKNQYHHFNGSTYYSLFDKDNNWIGYINKTGVTEVTPNKPKQGTPIKVNKFVTVSNGNYDLYQNFAWKKKHSANLFVNKTVNVKNEYHHVNGSIYYSTFDNQGEWLGYINKKATKENGAKDAYVPFNKYVAVENRVDLGVYRNLETLEVTGTLGMPKGASILAKGFYNHFNGSKYYSLYNKDNIWLGYVEEKDLVIDVGMAGKGIPVSYGVMVNRTNQKTYQNFNWKVKHQTKDLLDKEMTAKRVYYHSNGEVYYSIFDKKNVWYGYINAKFTKRTLPTLTGVKDQTVYMSDKKVDLLAGVEGKDSSGQVLKVKVTGSVDTTKEGTYDVVYSVVDKEGNQVEKAAKIKVVDDYAPIIEGVEDIKINPSTDEFDYLAGITGKDFEGNSLEITHTGEVNMRKAGTYKVIYKATDFRKHTTTVTREIVINKVTAPVLKGVTDTEVKKSIGVFDSLAGISAVDFAGENLDIVVSGSVDMTKSGLYKLTYTVTDKLDQVASMTREVKVINDIKPIINGVENVKQNVIIGEFDPMANVSAVDSDGKGLTVKVTGEVDAKTKGIYVLNYFVKDEAGNSTEVKREIEIFEVEVSEIGVSGSYTLKTGKTEHFIANIYPEEALNKSVTWTSSNEGVATVTQEGVVTTLSEGSTTISVTSANGTVGSRDLVVSNEIRGNLYISSRAMINNVIRSFGITFTNLDTETLYVKNIEVGEIGGYSSNYSEERLKSEGISTEIKPREELGFSLSSRFGWYESKLVIRVTVTTEDGITKVFETRG